MPGTTDGSRHGDYLPLEINTQDVGATINPILQQGQLRLGNPRTKILELLGEDLGFKAGSSSAVRLSRPVTWCSTVPHASLAFVTGGASLSPMTASLADGR